MSGFGGAFGGPNVTFDRSNESQFRREAGNFLKRKIPTRVFSVDVYEDFKAVGDGVTDDTAAFQAAASSGARVVTAPAASYKVVGTVTLTSNQTWLVPGVKFIVPAASTVVFDAPSGISDWDMVGPFAFVGDGIASGTNVCIRVTDGLRWRVTSPSFTGIQGKGMHVTHSGGTGSYHGDNGQVTEPKCNLCYVGLHFDSGGGAEYSTVIDPQIVACTTGMTVVAGNTIVLGGHITDNGEGVVLTGGANHGHGMFVGTNINHNTTWNVHAASVTLGHSFIGCHLYDGTGGIYLDNCIGVTFDGGHLTGIMKCDSGADSGFNYFRNMHCLSQVSLAGTDQGSLVFEGCTGAGSYISGVTINDPAPVYVLVQRDANAQQSLTSGVTATLTFNDEVFDRRGALTTGVFTCPVEGEGLYRCSGVLVFEGTALTPTASTVAVSYFDSRGPTTYPTRFLFTPGATGVGGVNMVIPVNFSMYLNPGDTLTLRATITGTTPTFGSATTPASSTWEIERIA